MGEQRREGEGGEELLARSAQQRSELHFRRLLEKMPGGAYICDPDGLITYFNQHAVQIWGRAPTLNDPVDRFCGSFKLFSVEGYPIAHDQCWMALALKEDREYDGRETVIERPDGQRLTVLAHANPIHDDAGNLLGAVNVLVDISDRKRAEDALKSANRAKNEFLTTLAHELRNPLAPIHNAVQIMHLKCPPLPELKWALAVIDRQMQHMTRLIDDLVDIARITSNKLELRRERIELAAVLQAAMETSRPLIEAARHEFVVTLPPEPIYLDGDSTRLAQVISNLLNNAAQYTSPGGRIALVAERQGSDAVVTVRDTGVGIPSQMLPRIFEMFTEPERLGDQDQSGLGIGLTLAKRLVDLHGGTIVARSDGAGQGSEFVVRVPVALESWAAPERAGHETSGAAAAASAFRILVVDDNQDSAASLGMVLRLMSHDVRLAHDGLEAVEVAEEFRPHVVLLDIGLPKMNGYDAARRIRQQPWGKAVVLIAATGWGQDAARHRSKEAGFDHHLVKPVDPAAVNRLLAALERGAPEREVPERGAPGQEQRGNCDWTPLGEKRPSAWEP